MKKLKKIEDINKKAEATFVIEERKFQMIEYLLFELFDKKFVLEISNIIEVIKVPFITPIPKSPDYVLGLINLRNEILTVLDLRTIMKVKESEITDESRIIVTINDSTKIGFLVDRVKGIIGEEMEGIKPVEATEENKFLKGAFEFGPQIVGIIDFKKLISELWVEKWMKNY